MKNFLKLITLALIILGTINTSYGETDGIIRRGKLKQRSNVGYKVITVVGKKATGLISAKATIAAKSKTSPQPTTTNFTMKVTGTNKNGHYELEADLICERGICLFAKDANPVGETYVITLTLLDSAGKQIGSIESINVEAELDKETCNLKAKLESVSATGLNYYHPKSRENTSSKTFVTRRRTEAAIVSFDYVPTSSSSRNGKTEPRDIYLNVQLAVDELRSLSSSSTSIYNFVARYNSKTSQYQAAWPDIDSVYITSLTATSVVCGVSSKTYQVKLSTIIAVNDGKLSFGVKRLKDQDNGNSDSTTTCPSDIVIGTTTSASLSNNGGIAVVAVIDVTFTNAGGQKNAPITDLTVDAIAELTGCDGKPYFITLPMTYSEKTKTYSTSKALTKCSTGTYALKSVTFKGKDKCGNTTTWVRNWQYSLN